MLIKFDDKLSAVTLFSIYYIEINTNNGQNSSIPGFHSVYSFSS